ncbi:hypothetical protein [Streptosporangium lutulentum]|uniref:Uncharacterized protein n=1 Tax=Streptosporangium lutulentum TaxID=1461250 RepID=A0ABT9Q697_9ACTN|nr:hypothetical protein [Streptosporangium lutulentum]MDP9842261.1 hypothetical protein [Streptosporangium lutulentum]
MPDLDLRSGTFFMSGDEHVDDDPDGDGDHRTEGEKHPLLTSLGADRGFGFTDQNLPNVLGLLMVDSEKPLLFFGLCEEFFASGLLGSEVTL